MSTVTVDTRPTWTSVSLALALAAVPVAAVGGDAILEPLAVEVVGAAILAVGVSLNGAGRRVAGGAGILVGAVATAAAFGYAVTVTGELSPLLRVLPGLLGVLVLTLGLAPVRRGRERTVLKVGVGLLFLTVLVAGVFPTTSLQSLLLGGTAAILAWDVGENAVNVGEQLGRGPSTWTAELTHAGAGGVVGVVGVGLVYALRNVSALRLSLPTLLFVLVGVFLLSVALHD